jgi:hypothetical protein
MATKQLAHLCVLSLLFILASTAYSQEYPTNLKSGFTKPVKPVEHRGFFKPFGPSFWTSTGVCVVGGVGDLATSDGRERNPLLRNSSGRLNAGRAVVLKLVGCGWPALIERRHPRIAFWARTVTGIVWGAVAMRN